jgi:hypothetical protein
MTTSDNYSFHDIVLFANMFARSVPELLQVKWTGGGLCRNTSNALHVIASHTGSGEMNGTVSILSEVVIDRSRM